MRPFADTPKRAGASAAVYSLVETANGKHIFGTVKVGKRGQIVIHKEAREIFNMNPGDTLLVWGDEEQGIAVVKADVMEEVAIKILKGLGHFKGEMDDENK